MNAGNLGNLIASPIRPPESYSIGSQLHRILRTAIIQGEIAPGQSISEVEISKKFSVSRQPVREAFIKLSEERLIEVLPQRGTYVRKISIKEVLDACYLREIIEVAIVREVAANPSAQLIAELRELIVAQSAVGCCDSKAFHSLDEDLHRALALYAGREYAWRIAEGIKSQMNRVRFLSIESTTPAKETIAEHAAIVDAIAAKNPDLAAAQMTQHLRKVIDTLPKVAERHPEHFAPE